MARETIRVEFVVPPLPHAVAQEAFGKHDCTGDAQTQNLL